jgi:hypothetical protein
MNDCDREKSARGLQDKTRPFGAIDFRSADQNALAARFLTRPQVAATQNRPACAIAIASAPIVSATILNRHDRFGP